MHLNLPKKIFYPLLLGSTFFIGVLLAHLSGNLFSEDKKFRNFTENVFQSEIQTNTLTLHYTLADPSSYGIHNYPVSLGTVSSESIKNNAAGIKELLEQLHTFHYNDLSLENRLTYDVMELSLNTELSSCDYPLLYEPLSPTLGIQAQLPVLLAEYTFRSKQDVEGYLSLLEQVPDYFEEILSFQQEKSASGYFMSDTTADRIISQCKDFIASPEENYLISVFNDKISNCSFLSKKKIEKYQSENKKLVLESLIPAYQTLSDGLSLLKGTGKNPYGLYHYDGGSEYYLYLIKSNTGIYDSIDTLVNRLYTQLNSDYLQIQRLLTVNPQLPLSSQDEITSNKIPEDPEKILTHLQEQMIYDFPSLSDPEYTIKYVHKDLEEYLSPAFYFTPPIDTLSPNSIYLNNNSNMNGLSLYSTLAHEGFPGHMYQTLYYAQTDPDPVRYLFSSGGYVEGWATYIENYAYQYAPVDYSTGQYLALNRSFYLCLYSLLDICIHYYGWTDTQVGEYLGLLGISDENSQKEIYQILIEDPANYLKYCLGSLTIQDLKADMENLLNKDFDVSLFHKAFLETGPAPFPIIEKYISTFLQN